MMFDPALQFSLYIFTGWDSANLSIYKNMYFYIYASKFRNMYGMYEKYRQEIQSEH